MLLEWFKNPSNWLTILGFLYAVWEFYLNWTSVNGWDWKAFVPALIVFIIAWISKNPKKDIVTDKPMKDK